MKKWNKAVPETAKRTCTVQGIATILNIGRSSTYQLVKEEPFSIVRIGNTIRISKKSFDDWLDKTGI